MLAALNARSRQLRIGLTRFKIEYHYWRIGDIAESNGGIGNLNLNQLSDHDKAHMLYHRNKLFALLDKLSELEVKASDIKALELENARRFE